MLTTSLEIDPKNHNTTICFDHGKNVADPDRLSSWAFWAQKSECFCQQNV